MEEVRIGNGPLEVVVLPDVGAAIRIDARIPASGQRSSTGVAASLVHVASRLSAILPTSRRSNDPDTGVGSASGRVATFDG